MSRAPAKKPAFDDAAAWDYEVRGHHTSEDSAWWMSATLLIATAARANAAPS
ncbi:MAG TPA: hypothetical protein VNO51_10060 [Ilumatobacteraceae bacterium]|nr:hypothetical protein [Ilumatobacteraceae bacterium]